MLIFGRAKLDLLTQRFSLAL